MRRTAASFVAVIAAAACGGSAAPSARHQPPEHVFLIVMENHSMDDALTGPFTASLAAQYGVAKNYHAITHPSVPNYLALTSGSTWNVTDDGYRVLPAEDLGSELTAAGVTWRAYMEGLTSAGCLESPLPYDPGHNPFAFYGGRCPSNVVPLTSMAPDLAAGAPRFSWIGPDRCHDTHDCPVATGDAWLRQEVTSIMSSNAWRSSVLFITWDEDGGSGDNHVLTLVLTPDARHRASARPYTHYSLLATIEDLLGVARLGNARGAASMTDLLP